MLFAEFDMIFSFGKEPFVFFRAFLLTHRRGIPAGKVFHHHAAAGVCDFDGSTEIFYLCALLGYGITFDDAQFVERIHDYPPCFSLCHA